MKWQPLLIALLFVLSQAALFAGFVGLWRRRPLVITGPGVAMVLVAGSVALLGACGWMVFEVGHSGAAMAGFMMAAAVSLLLVRVVHAAESSCIVIGTTRRWVRHAMRASFFRMSVPFHDESVDDDTSSGRNAMHVLQRLASYRPVHLVRTRNHHLAPFGDDLAREMDAYFDTNAAFTDTAAFRSMTAAGIVLLVAAIYVWLRWFVG